jgi:dihydroxyacetone kinase
VERAASALAAAPEGAFAGGAAESLQAVAATVRTAVGGSLGGLYNLGLTAAAAALPKEGPASPEQWAAALDAACGAVQRYGNAQAGSRTMLDALLPAAEVRGRVHDSCCRLRHRW